MTTPKTAITPYRSAAHAPQLRIVDQSKILDSQAPYSEEAEEALITSVIIDPTALSPVSRIIQPSDFYLIRHEMIWHTILRLAKEGQPFSDYLVLIQGLKDDKHLDLIGGPGIVSRLLTIGALTENAAFYAHIVLRAAIRRRIMYHADQLKALAVDESISLTEVINGGAEQWRKAVSRYTLTGIPTAFELVNKDMDRLEARNFADPVWGVPTGFPTWDALTGGLQKGFMYVGVAPTTHGKSAWSRQVAVNAARAGARVAYVSTEETAAGVIQIMLAAEAGIAPERLRQGDFTKTEVDRYIECAGRIGNLPLTFVDDSQSESGLMTPAYIRSCLETIRDEQGIDLIIVDYAQDIEPDDPNMGDNAYKKNTATAIALFRLSRSFNVPVLVMTQANRDAQKLKEKLNLMHYIEGSGKYGQKADFVFTIWHEYKDDPSCLDPWLIRTCINKNKVNGVYGLTFNQLHPSTKLTEYIRQNNMGEVHLFGSSEESN